MAFIRSRERRWREEGRARESCCGTDDDEEGGTSRLLPPTAAAGDTRGVFG
jgi:hypothetical protein